MSEQKCGRRVGSRPWWMGVDQYDPCHCIRPTGHEGECWCGHTDPARTIAATSPEATKGGGE